MKSSGSRDEIRAPEATDGQLAGLIRHNLASLQRLCKEAGDRGLLVNFHREYERGRGPGGATKISMTVSSEDMQNVQAIITRTTEL